MNKHMNTHRSLRLRTLNSARTWLPQAGLLLALGALPMLAIAQGQASVMRPPAHPAAKASPQEPNQLLHIPKAQPGKAMVSVMSGGGCERGAPRHLALLDRGEAAQVPAAVLAQRKAEQGDVVLANYSPPQSHQQTAVQPATRSASPRSRNGAW